MPRAHAVSARDPRRGPCCPRWAPTGEPRTPRALLFLTGAAVAAICLSSPPAARAQGMDPAGADDPVTMDDLQQATEPYGDWLDTPEYGRVWRPDQQVVGDDFEPYLTNGRWISADEGWAFESAWVWGWATFHYGRWLYDARTMRWLWCPDWPGALRGCSGEPSPTSWPGYRWRRARRPSIRAFTRPCGSRSRPGASCAPTCRDTGSPPRRESWRAARRRPRSRRAMGRQRRCDGGRRARRSRRLVRARRRGPNPRNRPPLTELG